MRRSELPSELVVEILARVPVRNLMRFRCVCKSWQSLFQDERFIEQHRTHASTRIVSFRIWGSTPPCRFSYSSSGKPEVIIEEVTLNIGAEYDLPNAGPIGQCHGLFCLDLHEKNTFGVWNPSLRELRRIQTRGLDLTKCAEMGFGYDHSSQDYKIVLVLETQGSDAKALVLSLKSGKSRMIDFPRLENVVMSHVRDYGTLVGENIYWKVHGDGETFLRFDLVSDTFSYCKGPSYSGDGFRKVIAKCLCTVGDDPCGGIIVWSAQHEKDKIGGGIKSWSKICSLSRAVLESVLSRGIDKI